LEDVRGLQECVGVLVIGLEEGGRKVDQLLNMNIEEVKGYHLEVVGLLPVLSPITPVY
jgi:hypothetical protein